MSDWKKDLENKEKELNIKKEENYVRTRIDIGGNSRNSSGRISSIRVPERNKEINKVTGKGGKGMITVEGALKDLEAIEKEATDTGAKAVVKALKVVIKFLSTMRSNQLLTEEEKVGIHKAREARAAKEVKK
jgi:hypothetical protein